MAGATFSDSWHRIADARVALLPTVQVHKQQFRGEHWFVLRDSYTQRFYRVTPAAWEFIARLSPQRSVDEVWRRFIEDHPAEAPGQDDVVQLLSQLHQSNMLYFTSQPDSGTIYTRYRDQRRKELFGKLMAFLYVRVPLWDPNQWLDRRRYLIDRLLGPWLALLWLVVVILGGMMVLQNSGAAMDQAQGVLAVGNLPWLYLCLVGLKLAHEFSHAFICKRFGGEVHTLGVMFLVFMPLPFIDATASWGFRSRWQRALVGSAGMVVELFIAAIAAIIWANSAPGLVQSLAFNVMLIGSVSSLLFNGNPLLRFDAYYILSDLIDIPNLYQKANQQWLYFADRWLLGTRSSESPAHERREWWWMTGYGFFSFFYRIFIMVAILIFVGDNWFEIAVILAIITLFIWVLSPLRKLWLHLASPRLHRNRVRAVAVTLLIFASLGSAIALWPLPWSIDAPGVLEAERSSQIFVTSEGQLRELLPRQGEWLERGDTIAHLLNPELALEAEILRQQISETELLIRGAMQRTLANLQPLQQRITVIGQRLADVERRQDELHIRAPHAGYWIAEPRLVQRQGSWLGRGEALGQVIDNRQFRFTAVVVQELADELFQAALDDSEVRLRGQADRPLKVEGLTLIPWQRRQLASSALGLQGGGEIITTQDERGQVVAVEGFYELRASVANPAATLLLHGLSGRMRIDLPPQPIFWQARRGLMQLLQKRYQL
jgi:putative peptide zinc metalloprotease protein